MSADPSCQTPGVGEGACGLPWSDEERLADKTRLWRYVLGTPDGAPVREVVRAVHGDDTTTADPDGRHALRFFRCYPDLFRVDHRESETAGRGRPVWVEPRSAAFHLTANKHGPKPTEGEGAAGDTGDRPRRNARKALGRRRTVECDGVRAFLLDALATYRETTEDRYHAFEDTFTPGEYLLVPYSTRFNSSRRVAEARERFAGAFDRAAREFDRAVCVTLTTDPSRFGSLLDAMGSLMDDVGRFKSWLATAGRLGSRPPSVVVPEFTESGLPHVHVVLFGVSWVVSHPELSHYWDARRDRGSVVWFDRLVSDGERWQWENRRRAHRERVDRGIRRVGRRSPRAYFRKSLDALDDMAHGRPESVREAARALRAAGETKDTPGDGAGESGREGAESEALARGREWWKLACYWAAETRFFTLSPVLKPSRGESDGERATAPDGTPLPAAAPPRWRYVGTARFGEFPGHVRERATVLTRGGGTRPPTPPPPAAGGGATGAAGANLSRAGGERAANAGD